MSSIRRPVVMMPEPFMSRVKQRLLDIGLWKARSVEEFCWIRFRPLFWRTSTNLTHQTYRRLLSDLYQQYGQDLERAYEQGLRDGALQAVEQVHAIRDRQWTPDQKYTH